jgi:hypothetical protein
MKQQGLYEIEKKRKNIRKIILKIYATYSFPNNEFVKTAKMK